MVYRSGVTRLSMTDWPPWVMCPGFVVVNYPCTERGGGAVCGCRVELGCNTPQGRI